MNSEDDPGTWVYLPAADVDLIDRLLDPSTNESAVLQELAAARGEEVSMSRDSLLDAVLRIGASYIRELAMERGYHQLAASISSEEHDERRATIRSRRRRAAQTDE